MILMMMMMMIFFFKKSKLYPLSKEKLPSLQAPPDTILNVFFIFFFIIFTFILLLPEREAGIVWELSNEDLHFLSRHINFLSLLLYSSLSSYSFILLSFSYTFFFSKYLNHRFSNSKFYCTKVCSSQSRAFDFVPNLEFFFFMTCTN